MKIGINCLNISPGYSGGSNAYALGLIEGFLSLSTPYSFQLYVTHENHHLFKKYETLDHVQIYPIQISLPFHKKIFRFFFLFLGLCLHIHIYKYISDLLFKNALRDNSKTL